MKYLTLFFLGNILLAGCEDGKTAGPYQGKVAFKEEFKHLFRINLAKELGDSFQLENNGVIKTLYVSFDKSENKNIVTDEEKATLFSGTASKYKGLIFLNHVHDSLYYISAIKATKHGVQGLCELEQQQKSLDSRVKAGFEDDLILMSEKGRFVLETDKKALLSTFSTLLLEFPEWAITN